MADERKLDVSDAQLNIVCELLHRHVPQYEVWAFGSRVRGSARRFSDLDLVVLAECPLPLDTSAALKEAFSESDLPWTVDVVDWASTSPAFRDVIRGKKIIVQRASGSPT
ncbi:MAG TPA: nucleotidyltransferase domain-containing protein [Nevskiaceae bacterium]|nr:nucleotidyltransferase domain-containing protein [Nevskiaceae bacterium]